MFVLGTAGHVDHGKSALLRALTSQNPDRLPEEKKRGLTIEPNYLWMETPAFGRVGFVDVPGHRRFVKNMVTGAASFDAFLFVVAADDGWMPQSEEHARILKALGITRGIVVVSKIDLVDEDHLKEVENEIASKGQTIGLRFEKLVRFSTKLADTVEAVRREVLSLVAKLPAPDGVGPARLYVDRTFVPWGQGVVVTGMLRDGKLAVGDDLFVSPKRKRAVVRSLQAYGRTETTVVPASRVAVGLGGVTLADLKRGTLLCARDVATTDYLEADVTFWEKAPTRNVEASFHWETARTKCLVIPLGEGFVRVKLSTALPVRSGDKFLLRSSGEERSWGGGTVIDPRPPKEAKARALERLAAFTEGEMGWEKYLVSQGPWLDLDKESVFSSVTENKLCDANVIIGKLGKWALRQTALDKAKTPLDRRLIELGADKPDGISAETVANELGKLLGARPPAGIAAALCDRLVEQKLLGKGDRGFVAPSFRREISTQEKQTRDEVLKLVCGPEPVSLKEWYRTEKPKRELVHRLSREGALVFLADDHFLAKTEWDGYVARVRELLKNGPLSTVQLRDALGVSRKNAVLVLEKLDREGITFFRNNERRLGSTTV